MTVSAFAILGKPKQKNWTKAVLAVLPDNSKVKLARWLEQKQQLSRRGRWSHGRTLLFGPKPDGNGDEAAAVHSEQEADAAAAGNKAAGHSE